MRSSVYIVQRRDYAKDGSSASSGHDFRPTKNMSIKFIRLIQHFNMYNMFRNKSPITDFTLPDTEDTESAAELVF